MEIVQAPVKTPNFMIGHRNPADAVIDTEQVYMQTAVYVSWSAAADIARKRGYVSQQAHEEIVEERDRLAVENAEMAGKLAALEGLRDAVVNAKQALT